MTRPSMPAQGVDRPAARGLSSLAQHLGTALGNATQAIPTQPLGVGRLQQAVGTLLRARGVRAGVGEMVRLTDERSGRDGFAEVVGFDGDALMLSPLCDVDGLSASTQVMPAGKSHEVAVGDFALGRVISGMGDRFLDDGTAVPSGQAMRAVSASAPSALTRLPIETPLEVGIAAIDGLLTCGIGQRVGIFAAAGSGKSTLLSTLCRQAKCDVVVVALVGERGREVGEFITANLDAEARTRCVIVAATSDRPACERLKAAFVATAHAEHFASQGKHVLLLVDSVTRMARAAREIGLAAGEPPTRRGFPPSVFSLLPRLFERAGTLPRGAITAFYTVLEETEDGADPVGEEVRSLLDGHLVLSRQMAGQGHYPAIDVLASASRVFDRVAGESQIQAARAIRTLLSRYAEVEVLLRIGEFRQGSDAIADCAVARRTALQEFLRQGSHTPRGMDDTRRRMADLAAGVIV